MTGIYNVAIPARDRLTRNRAHEGTRRKHGSSGSSSRRDHQAIKATGVIARIEPGEFSKLMNRANDPLILLAEGGLFSKNYQYLMSYKGIAFFTKSGTPLPLPGRAELVTAGRIWVPGG
jgi:hypothetical protein